MTSQKKKARPVQPKFNLGDRVRYIDRDQRLQRGEVQRIEATWVNWGTDCTDTKPHISYQVSHPTYRNGRMHLGEDRILGHV
jgi:hypothetical protein